MGCNKYGKYICALCLKKAPYAKCVCPMCEKPSIDGMTHSKCDRKYGLDGLISLWDYKGVIRNAIVTLKYKYATELVNELAEACLERLRTDGRILNTTLVPVPLYWYRKNYRGFNQSELVAKVIAKKMGWNFVADLLIRKKQSVPQAELKGADRRENIKGVFALNPNYLSFRICNSVIILDDVWTTGSTIKEAAKVLKRAGAKNVWGLTIAR